MSPIDVRGRLQDEPFSYRVTKSGRIFITTAGRQVAVVTGTRATRLAQALARAQGDPTAVQLLLAKASGHYKHGNER